VNALTRTRMCIREILITSALVWLLGIAIISPSQNRQLATFAQKLRQHHVELTRASLLNALASSDPEVRFLAAAQLASEGGNSAVPAIRGALVREQVPLTKVNIAFALAQLNDSNGRAALHQICNDPNIESHIRLLATTYLLEINGPDCVTSVLDILQNDDDPADRMEALSLLPRFTEVSQIDAARISAEVQRSLQDPTPAVRISAGDVIARILDQHAAEYLRAAISREGDDVVRSQLQSDLARVEKNNGAK
jgi:HEAT repeat protein